MKYTDARGQKEASLYNLLKAREFTQEQWIELAQHAKNQGVFWFTSPDSPESIDFLHKHDLLGAIKIMGGDMTYIQLIEYAARTGLPILLDTRGTEDEVDRAVEACVRNGNEDIIVVHCPSGYPAKTASLGVITRYRERYPYPIGFSDHSHLIDSSLAAVALGANFIEKCVSLDPGQEGIEHIMSIEPCDVRDFMERLTNTWKDVQDTTSFGNPDVRRSIALKRSMKVGDVLTPEDICFKRPGHGLPPIYEGFMETPRLTRDVEANQILVEADFN